MTAHPRRVEPAQRERTAFAWTRTSLVVMANGALLVLGPLRGDGGSLGLAAAVTAVIVAAFACLVGLRRQRLLARQELPQRLTPRVEVCVMSLLVTTLIVMSVLVLIA